MLEAFGVSAAAETIYLQLLRDSSLGVSEVAERLGWPHSTVRAALDELSRLALLRPSWDDPMTLRPVAPDVGLEALLDRQQAEVLARQQQLAAGRAALTTLAAEYAQAAQHSSRVMIEEVTGLDAVRDRLAAVGRRVRDEVLSFEPDGAQTAENLRASRPLDAELFARGVRVAVVYLDSIRNDAPTTDYANWLAGNGGRVRTAPTLPLRMIIADREIAILPLDPDDSTQGAAVLTGGGPVAALCALFDRVWEAARPLGESARRCSRPQEPPAPQERELLRMLARGDTDEAAARSLGVSVRTVGRMVAELMERLAARSRFQAGARAVAGGWLDEDREVWW